MIARMISHFAESKLPGNVSSHGVTNTSGLGAYVRMPYVTYIQRTDNRGAKD